MAEHFITENENKQKEILKKKKRELADIDADLEDFMHVATDGKYNLKILNDAFEGKAHENEEFDLVDDEVTGEKKIKKRTKRPPKDPNAGVPPKPSKPSLEARDPRMEAIVADVMRQSAQDWKKNLDTESDMSS